MKQLFLQGIKIKENIKKEQNIGNEIKTKETDNINKETEPIEYSLGFDLEDYEQEINEKQEKEIITSIEGFRNYSLSFDNVITHKEARTAIEEKRPFIIAKRGKKASTAEEVDTIYRVLPKMKIMDKNVQRIGFIEADHKAKHVKFNKRKTYKYRGLANEEFLIKKKKGFNQRKIGYIPLMESTQNKELYVEITTSRGYTWLLLVLIIVGLIGLFACTKNMDGWHFNLDKLKLYKTKEIIEYQENELQLTLNATPVLNDGYININLSSDYVENVTYIARLYDENNTLIFESDTIKAGEGLEKIKLLNEPSTGEHEYNLVCETYKNESYIGEIESSILINIKAVEN